MSGISINSMTYTSAPKIKVSFDQTDAPQFGEILTDLRVDKNAHKGENFDDMYCHNYDWRGWSYEEMVESDRSSSEGRLHLSLGENELPEFMDMVIEGMKNGKTLEEICDEQNTKASKRSPFLCNAEHPENGVGSDESDCFIIDKDTGEVLYCHAKERGNVRRYPDYEGELRDRDTVFNIAEDLYTFLRYAAFPHEEDDSERVERLFDHIKEKQMSYSVTRFMPCFDPSRDGSAQDFFIPEITAEEKLGQQKDPIDEFMETLRVHQEKLSSRAADFSYTEKTGEAHDALDYFENGRQKAELL